MREKFLETYVVRCVKEIINLFNNDKFEIKKENFEIIENFFIDLKENEEIYSTVCSIYSKELKVIDYYILHQENYFNKMKIKFNDEQLYLDEEFLLETYLSNQELIDSEIELELLINIFSKKMKIVFDRSDLKLSIQKSFDLEKKMTLTIKKGKEKVYTKS